MILSLYWEAGDCMNYEKPRISVIIPTRNEQVTIGKWDDALQTEFVAAAIREAAGRVDKLAMGVMGGRTVE